MFAQGPKVRKLAVRIVGTLLLVRVTPVANAGQRSRWHNLHTVHANLTSYRVISVSAKAEIL
jgi:hypothetical protein